ncbi:UNVERIFIED_CONTAM: hypothetical protein H355_011486 [Colinus virginianus]|nr:hypothetical protein H355_011486 [Colinus virginianus]
MATRRRHEEARLQAEREAAARREKESMEREHMAKLEAKKEGNKKCLIPLLDIQILHQDQERREAELAELNSLEEKFACAQRWKTEYRAYTKWEHYVACDGSPDPTVLPEINTFMSLWREDQTEDIQSVVKKGEQVLKLIEELQFLLLDMPPSEITEKETAQYQETMLELENLLHQKYNEATERLLKSAIMYQDSDTGNMQTAIKDKNVTFCLWANLKKKVRFRSHVFGDTRHGFDLPKSLAVSSIAVRILHTRYDHVSPLWLQCQRVPRLEASGSEELPQHSEGSAGEPGEEKETREEPDVTAEEMLPDERNSAISFRGNTNSIADTSEVTEEKTEKKSETLDIPPEVQLPQTQEKTGEEEEVTDRSTVDLQQFVPVGGVYHIDALRLPPQVQQINGWSMVELIDGGLEAYPYPPQGPGDTTHPPIQITLGLPNNVMYWKQPVIARWDPAGEQWRTDGISNITYKTQEKSITFETDAFYTIALLQDVHLNMPYRTWELRPTGTDEALFIITTVFAEVQIQIKGNQCMLAAADEEKSVLSHLIGKWMCPLSFRRVLKKGGLNIFPEECSYKYVYVNKKVCASEWFASPNPPFHLCHVDLLYRDNGCIKVKAYQQMALVASAFAFSWSKWNLESGQDQVVFKVREHLKAESVTDEEWSLYMFSGQRAQKLKISETSEAFSAELEADSEFHSTLYHMLRDSASEAAIDKVNTANFLFVDAVRQLLLATRVLTYS